MNKKQIITSTLFTIFLIGIFYISGIVGILEFILSISVYSLIFYFFHFICRKIRKKEELPFWDFFDLFLYKAGIVIVSIVFILWFFSYYNNSIKPAPMPEITISNWDKIVVFQAMSHIGTQDFYDTIQENILRKKEGWYVYFFEGVKPGSEENHEKFNQALWVEFNKDLYENLSKLYGVVNQKNEDFLWLVNDLDFNVDLNLDQIIEFYEASTLTWSNEDNSNILWNSTIIDANKEIIKVLTSLNEKQLEILRYINKAILNFIIKSEWVQNILTENFSNEKLFDIILDKRNEVLSNEITASEYQKIYTTYWLLHFQWTFDLLQKEDSNWKIIWTKDLFPIQ